MKRFFYLLFIPFLMLVACREEQEVIYQDPVDMTVNTQGTFEVVPSGPSFTWETGDSVSIFDGRSNNKFTYKGGFEGLARENRTLHFLYPYDGLLLRYSGRVKVSTPASQTVVPGGIAKENVILVAESDSEKGSISFSTPLSYGKMDLNIGEPLSGIEISGSRALAGTIWLSLDEPFDIEVIVPSYQTISLSGDLKGTLWFSLLPGELDGVTITFISSDLKRSSVKLENALTCTAGAVVDFGSYGDQDVLFPSNIQKTGIFRVSFAEDEFNLVSEPGFEEYPDQPVEYATRWVSSISEDRSLKVDLSYGEDEIHQAVSGIRSVAIRSSDFDAQKWHKIEQTVPLYKNTDYVFTAYADGNRTANYMGVNARGGGNKGHEIAGKTWTKNGSFVGKWVPLTMEFNTGEDYWGYVFFGTWGTGSHSSSWYRLYMDDARLIPKGYDKTSTQPVAVEFKGSIANQMTKLTGNGKVVAWPDDKDNVYVAFENPEWSDGKLANGLGIVENANPSAGLTVSTFNGGKTMKKIMDPVSGSLATIINGGFSVGGKTYIHYAAKSSDDYNEDPKLARWSVMATGFLVSTDNGATWMAGPTIDNSFYAQSSFCVTDEYVCMVTCCPGRTDSDTDSFFISRIAKSATGIDDMSNWEHWNGTAWTKDPIVNNLGLITMGAISEPAIIWNPQYQRFMLFYRSSWQKGIVYRDSDRLEGPWSGEKVLTCDDINGSYYAPSAVAVEDNGAVWLTVSEF